MTVLLVTGTGTDVGKTVVTAAVVAAHGRGVAVVKPAQTGVRDDEPGDLAEVTRLSGCTDTHEYARYPDPLSPHAAARTSGRPTLTVDDVADRVTKLVATHELVLVEGAGGLLVPFADRGWTMRDLARELSAPLVLVTSVELGTLNTTALTLEALAGASLAGLVIGSWPAEPELVHRNNVTDLATLAPLAGAVPAGAAHRTDFRTAAHDWLSAPLGGRFDPQAFERAATAPAPRGDR